MKRLNYFQVHKNKSPKRAKYSNPYTRIQLQKMAECMQIFIKMAENLKGSIKHIDFDNFKNQ